MFSSVFSTRKRLFVLSLPLALAGSLLIAGCHTEDKSGLTGAPSSTMPIATVNGEAIDAGTMFDAMQHYTPVKTQNDLESPTLAQPVGRTVLSQLIQNVILLQTAKQKNVPVTDSAVADRYEYIKELEEKTNTIEPFDAYLADEGYTVASFENEQIKPLVARFNLVSVGQTISDAAVKTYFDKHPEKYAFPDRVHIQRIVLSDKITANAAHDDAVKNGSFRNFLDRNLENGVPGAIDNSDIPRWEALSSTTFPPAILKLVQSAKTGDVLPATELQKGRFWVIRVVERQPAGKLDFDKIKGQVKLDALSEAGMQSTSVLEVQQSLKTALQTANIQIYPKQYQSLAIEFKAKAETPASGEPSPAASAPPASSAPSGGQ